MNTSATKALIATRERRMIPSKRDGSTAARSGVTKNVAFASPASGVKAGRNGKSVSPAPRPMPAAKRPTTLITKTAPPKRMACASPSAKASVTLPKVTTPEKDDSRIMGKILSSKYLKP